MPGGPAGIRVYDMVVGDAVHRVIPLIVPAGDHCAAGDIQALDILRVVPIRVLDRGCRRVWGP